MELNHEDWQSGIYIPTSIISLPEVSQARTSEGDVKFPLTSKTYEDISCAPHTSTRNAKSNLLQNQIRGKLEDQVSVATQENNSQYEASNIEELKKLLISWNLEYILDHLIAEQVYINILKIIKRHHVEKLLKLFDMGTQIAFEHYLDQWRQELNLPFDGQMPNVISTVGQAQSSSCSESSFTSEHNSPSSMHYSPYSPNSPTPDEGANVMLATILNASSKAHTIVQYYHKYNKFQEDQRNSLISVIARYFEDKGISMSMSTSSRLEKEILDRFSTEKLEYYRTSKRGKLYNKWRNSASRFKSVVANYVHPIKSIKQKEDSLLRSSKSFVPEEDAEACIQTLKFEHISAEEFDNVWKACSRYRLNQIKTLSSTTAIIDQWPFYKQPSGYRLIDMDFEANFEIRDGFLKQWPLKVASILSFLSKEHHVKDKNVKTVLAKLANVDLGQNGTDAALLWALHGYFVPTNKVVKKDVTGKKTTTKYTIRDSQQSFLFLGKSVNDVENHIMFLRVCGTSIQPFVYCVGENIFEVESVGVFFDNIRYKFLHVIRALDICFKIIYLFNFNFPPES